MSKDPNTSKVKLENEQGKQGKYKQTLKVLTSIMFVNQTKKILFT